ncbi:LysM peptidoglycan-binding domain-containing protein [uncultured Thiodictyon sp.]|uniref:LysM peptidoglycan-binding domain-containing protein n=1 Tax=uncultured Thiodictyon sp. TaxID=1846217 RepID=UPI0025FF23D7|nr:LysM peptidoglycan-binding domain-containing protein [uncultured Thiodictyon sp.]
MGQTRGGQGPAPRPGGCGASGRWCALILLAVGMLPLPLGQGARADEPAVAGAARPTLSSEQVRGPRDPAPRVEALNERIHGLEGKLLESAAARKAADQARMEAERRLAEAVQESDLLREAKTALETRLKDAEEQLAGAEEQIRRLGAETAAQAQRGAALEGQLEELKGDRQRLEEGYQGRLHEAELSQADLSAELAASKTAREALADQLKALGALVPAPAGGALTLEAAQAQSAAAAAALREALARVEAGGTSQAREALREAEQRLHRNQFAAAQMADARGLYQVRPADTLVLIARHFYGDGSRWRAIREANRDVLADANRLIPGLTLVIP